MLRFLSEDTTTPSLSELFVVVVVGVEEGDEAFELGLVLISDFSEGDGGGGLLVDELAESSFTLNEGEGDVVLSAELGQEDNELNGVNVVGDKHELGLLVLNEGGDVVKTELDDDGLLGLHLLVVGLSLSSSDLTGLLLSSSLGSVLSQELDEVGSCERMYELAECASGRYGSMLSYSGSCQGCSRTGGFEEGP